MGQDDSTKTVGDNRKFILDGASVSDLRLSINSIVGVLDLLMMSGLTTKQLKYVEMARTSGKEMSALLNRVSDFGTPQVPSDNDDQILDASVVRRPRLVALFLEHVPKYMDSLAKAIDRQDAQEIEQRAHKLKGSALAFGARRMADLCLDIEMFGRNCAVEKAPAHLENLQVEFEKVQDLLRSQPEKYTAPNT